ncbi:MAG: putative glycogen debranching enzyme [Planctomycetota bacterium]|jgi:predicted glycogen debranching enzyme
MNTHDSSSNWEVNERHEWLMPFANGGYASGTISGPSSRSYHGFMVAGLSHPWDRVLVMSHVDVRLIPDVGKPIDVACHNYGDGVIHPHGVEFLNTFEMTTGPHWHWEGPSWKLSLSLLALGGNTISLKYRLSCSFPCTIELRPFVAWRNHHGGESLDFDLVHTERSTAVDFVGADHRLHFDHDLLVSDDAVTHENFRYEMEMERGLHGHEDLRSPFVLTKRLSTGHFETEIRVGLTRIDEDFSPLSPVRADQPISKAIDRLKRAALDFLIKNPTTRNPGIVAGYPWFNEWGRDTMIALPGMVKAAGDQTLATRILEGWTSEMRNGLLPNRLAEGEGECWFNSADAPLWYLGCVARYWNDSQPNEAMRAGVFEVLDAYLSGTEYDIKVDPADGLLSAGDIDTQLTWMDACHEGECFTPRMGKCVELNALLFDGLQLGVRLAHGRKANGYQKAADRLRQSFRSTFIDETVGLKDCLSDSQATLRPNQLFALASSSQLVDSDAAERALAIVESELLTPFGMRTLNTSHPDYKGQYRGGPKERDKSYHQGTVWMWLMGPFIDALMNVRGHTTENRHRAEELVASCLTNLDDGCIGQLNEIFEGDAPHRACGSPAQAWSSCELLRVVNDWGLDESRINLLCDNVRPK